MDHIDLAGALFDESEPEQGTAAAQQALVDTARVDSTLVASSRLNTLLAAVRPHRTAAVEDVRTRAADLAASRPPTAAA
ncbi:hypothetical protein [Streptomyces luteireticuli]|uniref:hypothetical protein n=1 Tax=Streptomyces luteireticuli TaxID=173858 RepID=UPI003556B2D6